MARFLRTSPLTPPQVHPREGPVFQGGGWDHSPVWGEVYRGLDKPQFRIRAGQRLQGETSGL